VDALERRVPVGVGGSGERLGIAERRLLGPQVTWFRDGPYVRSAGGPSCALAAVTCSRRAFVSS
jgi:hypothetical protein